MSDTASGISGPSQSLASGAGRTVTAFFDTRAAAQTAVDDLTKAGIASTRVSLVEGGGTEPVEADAVPTQEKGFWATLKDLFMPDEDRHSYGEGLRRGGFLVAVRDEGADHDRIVDILDRDGTVDMDEREHTWRSEGWAPEGAGRDRMAEESLGRAGSLPPSDSLPRSTQAPLSAPEAAAAGLSASAAGPGAPPTPATPPAATGLGATVPTDELREAYRGSPEVPAGYRPDSIPPDEEAPGRIGRRDPDLGRARVRSYLDEGL